MSQFGGVLRAVVLDNHDPDALGRVKVRLAQASGPRQPESEAWAPVSAFMPPVLRETWVLPEVHDEVLVAFERGDLRRPYVIGFLRSAGGSPPEAMDATGGKTVLRSRGGVTITLDDENGQQSFKVETPGGQKFTLELSRRRECLVASSGASPSLSS